MSGENVALPIKDGETGNPLIPINKLNFIYTPHDFMYTALTVEKYMWCNTLHDRKPDDLNDLPVNCKNVGKVMIVHLGT